jgi:hypothetical protein
MNERIKELIKQMDQAGLPYGDNAMTVTDRDLEYFAELILQECFQACMNEGASYEEKAAGAYQSNLYVTAIKQHFGVEE